MQAAVMYKPGDIRLEDVPKPAAKKGEGVRGYDAGELVGVAPMLPCRVCDQCLTSNFSRCRNYDYFGSRRDGAYAEFVAAPVGNLLKTPKGTDPRAIAMTDPASIALHAVWKAPPTMGERGAVVGCGPIGLFAIQWMRLIPAAVTRPNGSCRNPCGSRLTSPRPTPAPTG